MPFSPLKQSRYDPDGDGSVKSADSSDSAGTASDSDKLGGNLPSHYEGGKGEAVIWSEGFAPGFGG